MTEQTEQRIAEIRERWEAENKRLPVERMASLEYWHGEPYLWHAKRDMPVVLAEVERLRKIVPDVCPHCGGRMDVSPGHIDRCYCLPVIREKDKIIDELRQELARLRGENERQAGVIADFTAYARASIAYNQHISVCEQCPGWWLRENGEPCAEGKALQNAPAEAYKKVRQLTERALRGEE
jgi:hypothetical protein